MGSGDRSVRIVAVPMPTSVDDPAQWVVRAEHDLELAHRQQVFGHTDLVQSLRSRLALAVPYAARSSRRWAAVADDQVLGVATLRLTHLDNQHLGQAEVWVRADARGHGIGGELLAALEQGARSLGRSVLTFWGTQFDHLTAESPRALRPETGPGFIDGEHPQARFLRRHGFFLEQVEAYSTLELPLPDERRAALTRSVADAYQLVTWADRCPDEFVDQLAVLFMAMSTDAPNAGLDFQPEHWDAGRLRAMEQRVTDAGERALYCAARHRASGALVGYTVIQVDEETPRAACQEDTLVLRAHRGHRLGLAIKLANLEHLARVLPEVRTLHTWNADENGPMLAINRELGFVKRANETGWQKRLG